MTSIFPIAIDELILQEEDGSDPDIFRRQAKDFNSLAVKIRKLQETIGTGSPQIGLLSQIQETLQTSRYILERGPRSLFSTTGGATTVDTNATDLLSYSMPVNTMNREGDRLIIEAMIDVGIAATTTSETRTVRFDFGADQTTIFTIASGQQRRLFVDIEVIRLSVTSQRIMVRTAAARTSVGSFEANTLTSESSAEDLGSTAEVVPVVIKFNGVTGEPTHPIVQKYMSVTLYPI